MDINVVDFGFKNEYRIDLSDTFMAYLEKENFYKPSQCYYNAYKVIDMLEKHGRDDRIVYGYVLSTDGKRKVAVRHSWNRINDRKIDVTMLANDESPLAMMRYRYLPIDEYTIEEYREKTDEFGVYSLPVTQKERKYIKKLKEKGFEMPDYKEG